MAEIHVQPKKHQSNSAWVWILLLLLVAAAIVYFVTRNNNQNENNTVPANTTSYTGWNLTALPVAA